MYPLKTKFFLRGEFDREKMLSDPPTGPLLAAPMALRNGSPGASTTGEWPMAVETPDRINSMLLTNT